jgi:hypothetical protein
VAAGVVDFLEMIKIKKEQLISMPILRALANNFIA